MDIKEDLDELVESARTASITDEEIIAALREKAEELEDEQQRKTGAPARKP